MWYTQCVLCQLVNISIYVILLTGVDCGNLTDPDNDQVTLTAGTDLGQTATYSCNTQH